MKVSNYVLIAIIIILGIVIMTQNKVIVDLKNEYETGLGGGDIEKAKLIDSLHDELFISKVQNGRYELTFEHLKEVNPKLGKEMEDWMGHETE
jgi:hypothetical protein